MRNRYHPWLLLVLLAALGAGTSRPLSASGLSGFALELPVGPRAEAMGREVACLETGPMAAWGNVGGLGLSRGVQVAGSRARLLPDQADDLILSFGSGLVELPVGAGKHLVLNASFTRFSFGFSPESLPGQWYGIELPVAFENVYSIASGFGIGKYFGLGAGAKWLHDGQPAFTPGSNRDARKTTGPAFDVGALGRIPLSSSDGALQLSLGAALHNMGPRVQLLPNLAGAMLPHVARGGVGLEWRRGSAADDDSTARHGIVGGALLTAITVEMGMEKSLTSHRSTGDSLLDAHASYLSRHQIILGGGGEVKLFDLVALRAGYLHDEPGAIKKLTWGFGVDARHVAGFDFASVPQAYDLSRVKKFSLWLRLPFGHDVTERAAASAPHNPHQLSPGIVSRL